MRYNVICQKCQGSSQIEINHEAIRWLDVKFIISGRKRLDGNWGWQCLCGNNSIMTKQEKRNIANPAQPTAQELDSILKNIEVARVVDIANGLLVNNFIMQEVK